MVFESADCFVLPSVSIVRSPPTQFIPLAVELEREMTYL